jgi:hypothetical protein
VIVDSKVKVLLGLFVLANLTKNLAEVDSALLKILVYFQCF